MYEAIEDYCSCGELDYRMAVILELNQIIKLADDGKFFERDLMAAYRCYYIPSKHGIFLVEWLRYIKKSIEGILRK